MDVIVQGSEKGHEGSNGASWALIAWTYLFLAKQSISLKIKQDNSQLKQTNQLSRVPHAQLTSPTSQLGNLTPSALKMSKRLCLSFFEPKLNLIHLSENIFSISKYVSNTPYKLILPMKKMPKNYPQF